MGAVGMLFKVVVVFGLLFVTLRVLGRVYGKKGGRSNAPGASVEVLSRSSLGRNSSVVIVRIADRRLALGVTDQSVQVLTEVAPVEVVDVTSDNDSGDDSEFSTALPARTQETADRPSWRDLVESVRDRTVRR